MSYNGKFLTKIEQIYLFYPVALQSISGKDRIIFEFLHNTQLDTHKWRHTIWHTFRQANGDTHIHGLSPCYRGHYLPTNYKLKAYNVRI